jgi:hypothetical protein
MTTMMMAIMTMGMTMAGMMINFNLFVGSIYHGK